MVERTAGRVAGRGLGRVKADPTIFAEREAEIIAQFRDLYHNIRAPWTQVLWRGHQVAKCPMDLWIYQEIIWETNPDLIIELGSSIGGSALFFADITGCDVLTVDEVLYADRPTRGEEGDGYITYLTGSSLDPAIIKTIKIIQARAKGARTMVVLDSLHTYEHVSAELAAYGDLVTPGCYLVVEDTAVDESWGKPAAGAAAREFVESHPGFVVDESREKHLLTLNPGGWIRREF